MYGVGDYSVFNTRGWNKISVAELVTGNVPQNFSAPTIYTNIYMYNIYIFMYVCASVQSDPAAANTGLEGIYILYARLLEYLFGYRRRSVTCIFEE